MPRSASLVTAAALAALATPAAAEFQSAYTDINLDDCLLLEADDFGASWACPGYRGYPLYVAEGDIRFFLSYGFDARNEPVIRQTLPPFNYLGKTMEWRLSDESGRWLPVATIVRYFTQREEGDGEAQVLVVTALREGVTCHVAYIDATANADANEMAREAADRLAADFDCADEPGIIGEFKAW